MRDLTQSAPRRCVGVPDAQKLLDDRRVLFDVGVRGNLSHRDGMLRHFPICVIWGSLFYLFKNLHLLIGRDGRDNNKNMSAFGN